MQHRIFLQKNHVVFYVNFFFFNLAKLTSDWIDFVHLLLHHGIKNGLQFAKRYIGKQFLIIDFIFIIFYLVRNRRFFKKHFSGIYLSVL